MTKSNRLPAIVREQMTSEQTAMLDAILAGPRKNLNGPFVAWIHSPALGELAQRLGAFCRYETGLPLRLSELAILATAAAWQSQAEWHIHLPIAVEAGILPDVAEQIRQGATPDFPLEDERVIWNFANELYRDKRVSERTYAAAVAMFGLPVVVNLVGLLGYYALVAMTLNAFGMRAEGQGEGDLPFAETVL
ncbi:carboxymuconolactone decarboxylase family protein [Herbaspirillum seropedicae]|uniref:4-carboxymuconolactone decarboxylase domain protein n=1 Tax=Herbaspirillum seropedicae (strain SmR1) TaxID=757424 RepID=D8IQ86_HERSS|nr:carboxymuconolactone decarboxylase family protein [Herbaspirillum seropedicae]ADJ64998.1 4-carboxymuconolactone decarboxylase domain protein [Herbaspirillum seropedicae SmR1]AKN66877.1 4-carboxymuconolactone decarboxylase [Herbaspirillum seropedicae]NQE28109.1 4-carboxymuconolactone decarboxylase [Herbaspirillum seropedicae]UMU22873.1 carboxymuconolactone decarboxylase family protein [Herbaspirillum seropedicae]